MSFVNLSRAAGQSSESAPLATRSLYEKESSHRKATLHGRNLMLLSLAETTKVITATRRTATLAPLSGEPREQLTHGPC